MHQLDTIECNSLWSNDELKVTQAKKFVNCTRTIMQTKTFKVFIKICPCKTMLSQMEVNYSCTHMYICELQVQFYMVSLLLKRHYLVGIREII